MKKALIYVPVVLSLVILGVLEWVRTLYELTQVRAALGEPFTRMIVILGVVVSLGGYELFWRRTAWMRPLVRLKPFNSASQLEGLNEC